MQSVGARVAGHVGVRLVVATLLVAASAAPAHAEIAADLDFAGGVETMKLGKASRPSPVAEAGMHVGYDFDSWGIGASIVAVGRTQPLFDTDQEIHADLMLRLVSDDRRVRAGFGFGIRALTVMSADRVDMATLSGFDWAHARIGATLVAWDMEEVNAVVTLDSYVAWTLGCFSGSVGAGEVRDIPATNVRCADSLTSTAIMGISLGIRTVRPRKIVW